MKVQLYTHPGSFSCRTMEDFLSSNGVQYEHHLGITLQNPATQEDLEDIATPVALI